MSKEVWLEILHCVNSISNVIYNSVNPPASYEKIVILENRLNLSLPNSFKGYLNTFNGQMDTNTPLLGYNCFFSIEDIVEAWAMMNTLFEEEEELDWVVEDKIKPVIWSKGWIPFASFESNTRLILDLNPGKNGKQGQVFFLQPGMDYLEVIAPSFEVFSLELLDLLQSKEFTFEDGIIQFNNLYIV